MVKHKSVQEMMAARNPLARIPVAPVDIYSALPEPAEKPEEKPELVKPSPKTEPSPPQEPEPQPPDLEKDNALKHYSTYLTSNQIKGVKLRAIYQEINDFEIIQKAVDEYFQNHPL